MLSGLEILFQLVAETLRWCRLTFRSSRSIKAENLFLRRQLALYDERGVKPQRIDPVTRIELTLISGLFSSQDALVVVVRPETMIRWHRAGWKLFWRLKSRPEGGGFSCYFGLRRPAWLATRVRGLEHAFKVPSPRPASR